MKRTILAAAAVLLSLALFSCKDNAGGPTILKPGDSVTVKKYTYSYVDSRLAPLPPADSEYKNDDDSVHIIVSLDLDLPEGNSILARRVREWVNEQISFNNQLSNGFFDGNLDDAQAIADFYGKDLLQTIEKDIEAPIINGHRSIDITASKYYENDKCVTWMFTVYEFMGGAHPSQTAYGATFRKSDGRMFGNDMFSPDWDNRNKLDSLIVENLCSYFSEGVNEKIDDDQLFHEFTNEKITETTVALPKYGPWFSQTGVEFVYQQYEITAYAFGMPSFTLPYEKAKGFLTPAAADLVK